MKLLSGFGRAHVILALTFCLVVELAHTTYALLGDGQVSIARMLVWLVINFGIAVLALATAVATDNALGPSATTGTRLVVAMLVVSFLATLFAEGLLLLLPPQLAAALYGKEANGFVGPLHRFGYEFTKSAGWALLLIALYTMIQASRRATERLHTTRLAALAAQRNVVEADLRAMQARVDPDVLFAALCAVDEAYAGSPAEGERALDALIAFLRAALPGAGASSTVAAEVDLVRAYAGVLELVSGPSLKLDVAMAPEASTQPMPAMLVLPLARWALDGAAVARLSIAARRENGSLQISLASDVPASAGVDPSPLAGVRTRLAHLFGDRARLDASAEFGARVAIISLPA